MFPVLVVLCLIGKPQGTNMTGTIKLSTPSGGSLSLVPVDTATNDVWNITAASGGITYPTVGIPVSTGSAWSTSITLPGGTTSFLREDGAFAVPASSMTYPGAGIPNSTGSAWGTSYTTTGSGTVLALATSPSLTTPVLGTPTSGNLSNCTADGTNAIGYLHVPQNSQSVAYQTVLTDAGKHILHPSADTTARTFTIPANGTVAYPIGTALTFVNQNSGGVVTIAITTDTMRLAGAGTTGDRTLAANGIATALKLTSTEWIISGTGLT
jgi:hypothetical protein